MPRYFFDITDNSHVETDREGITLPDVQHAIANALQTLPDLAREVDSSVDSHRIVVTVRDERTDLYTITLSLAVTQTNEGS